MSSPHPTLHLQNAKLPACLLAPGSSTGQPDSEGCVHADIVFSSEGCVLENLPSGSLPKSGINVVDAAGRLLLPTLLDSHTHLDKTHTWDRAPNPTGRFWDAIPALAADSKRWTADDLLRRADFGLRSAYAHGTSALRTHLDTSAEFGATAHDVALELRARWKGRIEVQSVALCFLGTIHEEGARIQKLAAERKATALGGFPQPNPDLPRQLDYTLSLARELGIGIDLHVDESGLIEAECLRATAEAVIRNQFPNPVACGHNCSLAVQDPARALDTLQLVREAGIQLISLPLCNLYLQDRTLTEDGRPRTPRWRGITLLHEAAELGITVACASDNVRDAFYAYGDYDMLDVWRAGVQIGHLDNRWDCAVASITTAPAAIMGLQSHGHLRPGATAGALLTDARSLNELCSRRHLQVRRLVNGSFATLTPPDLTELS